MGPEAEDFHSLTLKIFTLLGKVEYDTAEILLRLSTWPVSHDPD